jgi:hypothetical protein
MGFRFELVSPAGASVGSFETAVPDWNTGDIVFISPQEQYRVISVVPLTQIAEFVDDPISGVLEVEPL